MLPPFVPPSARAAAESLPLITEFVYHRTEQSFEETWSPESQQAATAVADFEAPVRQATDGHAESVVPPITDFLASSPSAPAPSASVEPSSMATQEQAAAAPTAVAPTEVAPTGVAPIGVAPAGEGEPQEQDAGAEPEAKWVVEERNAFDWNSVATLATRPNDEKRAEDDWAATDWERGAHSEADQISALLTQVARRVRAGELKVEATRGMSAEAALAATLAALLRNDD